MMENEKRLFDPDMKIIDKHFNKRLIDANELQFKPDTVDNVMNGVLFVRGRGGGKTAEIVSGVLKYMIDNARTVDAVEVVRCKDCKHWLKDVAGCTDFVGRCEWANYMVGAVGYCVYGERKDNG